MPKKMGVNTKAEEAKARKAAMEAEKKHKEAKQKEDNYWLQAEGPKSKAAKKREEEEAKRAEAAAKKAEAKRLAEQEEREIAKSLTKPDKKANRVSGVGGGLAVKVTEAELRRRKEKEEEEMRRRAEEARREARREKEEEEYERVVLVENKNREEGVIEASSVEEAIVKMSIGGGGDALPVDKHPEKRLKASFKAFEEVELPRLKAEKPGLAHTQYKDMIWKLWKKSPDNPLNREA